MYLAGLFVSYDSGWLNLANWWEKCFDWIWGRVVWETTDEEGVGVSMFTSPSFLKPWFWLFCLWSGLFWNALLSSFFLASSTFIVLPICSLPSSWRALLKADFLEKATKPVPFGFPSGLVRRLIFYIFPHSWKRALISPSKALKDNPCTQTSKWPYSSSSSYSISSSSYTFFLGTAFFFKLASDALRMGFFTSSSSYSSLSLSFGWTFFFKVEDFWGFLWTSSLYYSSSSDSTTFFFTIGFLATTSFDAFLFLTTGFSSYDSSYDYSDSTTFFFTIGFFTITYLEPFLFLTTGFSSYDYSSSELSFCTFLIFATFLTFFGGSGSSSDSYYDYSGSGCFFFILSFFKVYLTNAFEGFFFVSMI